MISESGEHYTIIDLCGEGSSGKCFRVIRQSDNKEFVYKEYGSFEVSSLREIAVLKLMKGKTKYIIDLIDIISSESFGIIIPLFKSDLYNFLRQYGSLLTRENKIQIIHSILLGLQVLHKNSIIHRDLKPQNILLNWKFYEEDCRIENLEVCISDLGLGKKIYQDIKIGGNTHTPGMCTMTYRAPEIIMNKGYNFPSDLWSIGVITMEVFNGNTFLTSSSARTHSLYISRKCREFRFDSDSENLVKELLRPVPADRIDIDRAMTSKLFSESQTQSQTQSENRLSDITISEETKYHGELLDITSEGTLKLCEWYAQRLDSKTNITYLLILAQKIYEINPINYIEFCPEYDCEEKKLVQELNYTLYL